MRLTLLGPIPPPINGQSLVMKQMVSELEPHFAVLRIVDTSEGKAVGRLRPFRKILQSAKALSGVRGSEAVYIAVKAGHGMWLTTAAACLARIAGARVFLHHHSYSYVRERKPRMVALTRAAGPLAHHIVLSQSMLTDLGNVMPEIHRGLIIGNAGLIDSNLLDLPLKSDGRGLVLGHLSNLTLDKGIAEVVDLAVALHQAGTEIRLVIAGPTADEESRLQLSRASAALGEQFEYRGPLSGQKKRAFFGEITHFIFPSRYIHEAAPLVIYEAMAAGVICVATRQGAIPEQLEGSPGVLTDSADSFVEQALPALASSQISAAASHESRQAYLRALSESSEQLARFVALLAGREPDRNEDGSVGKLPLTED